LTEFEKFNAFGGCVC